MRAAAARPLAASVFLALTLVVAASPAQAQLQAPVDPNAAVDKTIVIVEAAAEAAKSMRNIAGKIGKLAQDARTVSTPQNLARQANSLSEQLDILSGDATYQGENLIIAGGRDYNTVLPDGPYSVRAVDLSTDRLGLKSFDFSSASGIDRADKAAKSAVALLGKTEQGYRRHMRSLSKKRVAIQKSYANSGGATGTGAPAGNLPASVQQLLQQFNSKPTN